MKTNILSIAIMAAAAVFSGCGQSTTENSSEETVKMMSVDEMKTPTTLAVKIEGMSCPSGCAAAIQEECGKLAGVGKSEVNFDEQMGYFTFDASILTQDDILKCVEGTNGGGIYKATIVDEGATEGEAESDDAGDVEALRVIKHEDEAHV